MLVWLMLVRSLQGLSGSDGGEIGRNLTPAFWGELSHGEAGPAQAVSAAPSSLSTRAVTQAVSVK